MPTSKPTHETFIPHVKEWIKILVLFFKMLNCGYALNESNSLTNFPLLKGIIQMLNWTISCNYNPDNFIFLLSTNDAQQSLQIEFSWGSKENFASKKLIFSWRWINLDDTVFAYITIVINTSHVHFRVAIKSIACWHGYMLCGQTDNFLRHYFDWHFKHLWYIFQ